MTNRPGDDVSYTSNRPHDPLAGNTPGASALMWRLVSVLILLNGIGWLVWLYARQYDNWRADTAPDVGFADSNRNTS